jgi:hypothetical protein
MTTDKLEIVTALFQVKKGDKVLNVEWAETDNKDKGMFKVEVSETFTENRRVHRCTEYGPSKVNAIMFARFFFNNPIPQT